MASAALLLERLDSGATSPLTEDPRFLWAGDSLCSDACTSWGLGFHIGFRLFFLQWSEETRQATWNAQNRESMGEKVSISPMELFASALLAHFLGAVMPTDFPIRKVVLRCDNSSAVDVVNSGKPKSPGMRVGMRLFRIASIQNRGAPAAHWHDSERDSRSAVPRGHRGRSRSCARRLRAV